MENAKKLWKLTGLFFGIMALFTLLSRAAYQHGTAVVETAVPAGGVVTHEVRLSGTVTHNQERAVTTVAGLRVGQVHVTQGQQVAPGEALLTLDAEYLDQAITAQRQELEKQKLSVQDAWSQNAAAQRQRENQQTQAQENYDRAVDQALDRVEQARLALEQAQQDLEDHYNGVSDDEARQAALEEQLAQAQSARDQAAAALDQLLADQERALQEALDQAASGGEAPDETAPTQVDQEALLQAVRDQYAPAISQAQSTLDQAQNALDQAQAEWEAFLSRPAGGQSEEELLAALEAAEEAYDNALTGLDDTEVTYGQAVRSASLPAASSHSAQIGQITYDQLAQELEVLERLQEGGGVVTAPVEGVVQECLVRAGDKTTDTTAVLLADLSQGCRFTGTVSQEQSSYIGVGDLVTLRTSSKTYEDLAVTAVATRSDGGSQLTVQLPANSLALGAAAQLSYTRRSQAYTCCVPLGALRLDQRNRPYVLVVQTVQTVLGAQTQARQVQVTVLEQGDTTAALAPGAVSSQDRVIVSSDRPIEGGSRVRVS